MVYSIRFEIQRNWEVMKKHKWGYTEENKYTTMLALGANVCLALYLHVSPSVILVHKEQVA